MRIIIPPALRRIKQQVLGASSRLSRVPTGPYPSARPRPGKTTSPLGRPRLTAPRLGPPAGSPFPSLPSIRMGALGRPSRVLTFSFRASKTRPGRGRVLYPAGQRASGAKLKSQRRKPRAGEGAKREGNDPPGPAPRRDAGTRSSAFYAPAPSPRRAELGAPPAPPPAQGAAPPIGGWSRGRRARAPAPRAVLGLAPRSPPRAPAPRSRPARRTPAFPRTQNRCGRGGLGAGPRLPRTFPGQADSQ